jgi:uncharacterized BrkB/YihY/UPF0761 family membrane protein
MSRSADPDRSRRPGHVRGAWRELVGLYWESGVSADIPALAWYLLSSLVPLALGLTALAAVVLGDYPEAQALATRVSRVLPDDVMISSLPWC